MVKNSRGQFGAVEHAQVKEFDLELQGWSWKSNRRRPTRQKERKTEETPCLICWGGFIRYSFLQIHCKEAPCLHVRQTLLKDLGP